MHSKFNPALNRCYIDIQKIGPPNGKYYLAVGVKISIFIQRKKLSINENI